eukprot:gene5917-5813_t
MAAAVCSISPSKRNLHGLLQSGHGAPISHSLSPQRLLMVHGTHGHSNVHDYDYITGWQAAGLDAPAPTGANSVVCAQ